MLNESPPLPQEIKETEIDGCESLKEEGWGKKCVDLHKEKWNMYFVMQLNWDSFWTVEIIKVECNNHLYRITIFELALRCL